MSGAGAAGRRRGSARYATALTRARWPVLVLVGVATALAVAWLPALGSGGGGLSGLVGAGNPAITAQLDAIDRFGLPLLSRTAVVQRDPDGLGVYPQARAVLRALEVDKRTIEQGVDASGPLLLALPLINNPLLFPAANEAGTTAVTYLFASPSANLAEQAQIARSYAATVDRPDDALVGVGGTIPLQDAQGKLITDRLPAVEIATLLAIALIIGFSFRSAVAPVVTLLVAVVSFLIADRLIGLFSELVGFAAPAQLRPIVVALTLGITTDYTIFFLSGMQRRLRGGTPGRPAARGAVTEYLPIVVVAGLTVAAGVATLVVAESGLFRAFGPGLAITVLVGLVVSATLVPALLAILGRWVFWPARFPSGAERGAPPGGEPGAGAPDEGPPALRRVGTSARMVGWLGNRLVATLVAAGVLALLVAASLPLFGLRASVSPTDALPPEHPVRAAADAATAGFAAGILSPTAVIVAAPAITERRGALEEVAAGLAAQPGVAMVLGPGDQPLPRDLGLFLAPDGGAARYLVVFDSDPLGAQAVDDLRALQEQVPGLLAAAGLRGVDVAYAGDTALGLSLVDTARDDLWRVAIAVTLVDLALLVLFLRALVAPLYLLATSLLGVGAALGLTTWMFQDVLGDTGIVFYVPFAAAVLLVSLGSDYNIFSVGYVWEEARRRPLKEALQVAVPRSSRAINAAGIALAVSFAFVALIPVTPFRQLAFAVAVGVLIDAFLIRSLLVPALISLVGRASGWPGRALAGPQDGRQEPLRVRTGHRGTRVT